MSNGYNQCCTKCQNPINRVFQNNRVFDQNNRDPPNFLRIFLTSIGSGPNFLSIFLKSIGSGPNFLRIFFEINRSVTKMKKIDNRVFFYFKKNRFLHKEK